MSRFKDNSPYKGKSAKENPDSAYNRKIRFRILRDINNTLNEDLQPTDQAHLDSIKADKC